MSLINPAYYVFAVIACIFYWFCAQRRTLRLGLLLGINLFVLARFGYFYPALLLCAASVDFLIGFALAATPPDHRMSRRLLLGISLSVNLFLVLATKLIPHYLPSGLVWVFPLSLSFYCLQSLSYTIDCYRGSCSGQRSYLAHLTATTFFAPLVAGPINRIAQLTRKLESPFELTASQGGSALLLICCGLVKKLLIADFLSDNLVNRIFDTPALYSQTEVLIAVYGYALQIYFDFSGYSDIAIGIARLFGIELPINFDRPYLSVSIRDFWKRWHISLSFWLRDYVYISLGGSRCGSLRTSLNLFLTMLVGGLWHGFTLTYVVWGLLHGCALAIAHLWRRWTGPAEAPSRLLQIVSGLVTFHFVVFTWIFFRATSMDNAWAVLARLGSGTLDAANIAPSVMLAMAIGGAILLLPKSLTDFTFQIFGRTPFLLQGAVLALIVLAIQTLAGQGSAGFVYQNF